MTPLSSETLQHFINDQLIQAVILPMDMHTPTVPEAARALNVETDQVIKSLVFMIKNEPVLVITSGLARVDRRKLAAYLNVGGNRVKFANADRALEVTGYVVGSMPPFGHLQKMRTFVDTAISRREVIFGGGGDIDAMMRITSAELIRATSAEILDISEDDG